MDFSALPPEVNSARLYAGPGAGSLTAAAAAWSTLSQELFSAAREYGFVVSSLAGVWQGPSATAMTTAAAPYITWLEVTAAQLQQTSASLLSAVAAYNTAYSATVPPPVIAANRAQLLALIASNVFGQNAPAIATLEAQYAAMWAQDAAAMNTYAASSLASTAALPQFTPAPQTAVPAQPAATTIGSILDGPLAGYLQAFISAGYPVDIVQLFSSFFGPFLGSSMIAGEMAAEHVSYGPTVIPPTVAPVEAAPVAEPTPVTASAGGANQLGRLSVPPSWASTPQGRPGPARPILARMEGNPKVGIPVPPAIPVVAGGRSAQRKVREDPEYGTVSKVLPPRHPAGG